MADALTLITSGQAPPDAGLAQAVRQIIENIKKSME